MESKKVLEKFLNVEFPSEFSEFTLKNKDFLVKYSILKENANTVLREIGEEITSETAYYEKYPLVKKAKELLQHRFKRFYNLYRGKKPKYHHLTTRLSNFWSGGILRLMIKGCYIATIVELMRKLPKSRLKHFLHQKNSPADCK